MVFLIVFGFMVQGGVMAILYLNLIPQPFDIKTYVVFIDLGREDTFLKCVSTRWVMNRLF